ncbi:MAG: hypothetical protein AB1744_01535 [Candidatus Zixiibacteriota bacterium]
MNDGSERRQVAVSPSPRPPGERRQFEIGRAGSAGLIVTMLVMGYLMSISASNNILIITESRGAAAGNNRIKSLAAAQAGINFYQSLLLATETTFDRLSPDDCRKRYHFASQVPLPLIAAHPHRQIATYTGAALNPAAAWYDVITNLATSTWMHASHPAIVPTPYDVPSSSLFIIKTYVDLKPANLASYVYVKSLGCYRELQGDDVIASYYTQLLARIEISTVTKKLRVDRTMEVPLEFPFSNTSRFYASMPVPWP